MTVAPATLDPPPLSRDAAAGRPRGHPYLVNGERLGQPEFHRRYEAMPEHVRAELIGGIVFMASPLRMPHGRWTRQLGAVLGNYEAATPGVDGADNATAILGDDSEPQPDLILRLVSECGGQTTVDADDYLVGGPELVIEVAHSTRDIDLHDKREDYRRAGVREYLVLCVEEREVRAFDLPTDRPWSTSGDGVFRSRAFPGLWIDGPAAFSSGAAGLFATARKGLRSPEHKAFAKRMAAMLAPTKPKGKQRKR